MRVCVCVRERGGTETALRMEGVGEVREVWSEDGGCWLRMEGVGEVREVWSVGCWILSFG